MGLKRIELEHFTAFSRLGLELSPGVNVLVGANGTGKTHLMKVCYAACDITRTGQSFAEKLVGVFLPSGRVIGRLVKRQKGSSKGTIQVYRNELSMKGELRLKAAFSKYTKTPARATITSGLWAAAPPIECVYIPVKEMLAHGPGFLSLYEERAIHFEEVYRDILLRAYRRPPRGPADPLRKRLLAKLEKALEGKVTHRNEEFFLRNKQGNFEFTLLAEGMRKLGLLWLLIQNGTLPKGSVLFWDEPETNLNPKLIGPVIDVVLELQRAGVQIFLATHDYVVLEELDLQKKDSYEVAFHALYREETGDIACNTTDSYLDIHPNTIAEAFTDLYDREIERSLKGATG